MKLFSLSLLVILSGIFFSQPGAAQDLQFVNAEEFLIKGQYKEARGTYLRFAEKDLQDLPERVQELSRNTAGLYLDFRTNSSTLALRWEVDEYRRLNNMTPIAVNGFDLYARRDGKWQFAGVARPEGESSVSTLLSHADGKYRDYRLYFPLYTGLVNLEIGIDPGAGIDPTSDAAMPREKVLIYGSSITQGASASRPGMAFPSLISRMLDVEMLNFGFSGSGKMELEVAKVISRIPSDLIILDCVPNPSPEQIEERTIPFIGVIRETEPNTPILMVESVFREHGHFNEKVQKRVSRQNLAFKEAYRQLKAQGVKELYYVESMGHIGMDHEATIDGTHYSDLGHYRMARKLIPIIADILKNKTRAHK